MKRRKLIHHLKDCGCELLREGGKHTVYYNPSNQKISTDQGIGKLMMLL